MSVLTKTPRYPSPLPTRALRFYVYLYLDPRTGKPFYIGKGTGERVLVHLKDKTEHAKAQRLRELHSIGMEPTLELLAWGLSEHEAHLVERCAIDLIGVDELTNRFRGHGAATGGRARLDDVVAQLSARPATILEPAVIVNISRLFHYGLSADGLYDAARGFWRIGPRRARAELVLAAYHGIVREVFRISAWLPAGSTHTSRPYTASETEGRWEFVGKIAEAAVRRRYLNCSVRHLLPSGAQNPIRLVNM